MAGKVGGKGRKSSNRIKPLHRNRNGGTSQYQDDDFMDDEIDAFHKQRDVVPLDMNDDVGDSDDDNEVPVYDLKGANDDDEDEDDDDDYDDQVNDLAAKIEKQSRYIQGKIGGAEDETHDDIEEEEDQRKSSVWGKKKNIYYDADNADFEVQTSDDDQLEEEEVEVLRLQQEKAKTLSMEDFGLGDVSQDESDVEPTFEDILVKGKAVSKPSNKEGQDETEITYEVVTKDLNALSTEEQMDIVFSSAPELVGLLSELNDALEQLENKFNPILLKVREGDSINKKGMQYMEMKKQLLLSYCQAITFYLLLKSEGQPVRDHPVIARLVEIKNLLDRVKQLDENLPSGVEDSLNKEYGSAEEVKFSGENAALESNGFTNDNNPSVVQSDTQYRVAAELVKVDTLRDDSRGKRKRQNAQVCSQSVEMLKVRAALEEKLKQRGMLGFTEPKPNRTKTNLRPINGQLEALDDFDDEAVDVEGSHYVKGDGQVNLLRSSKLSQLVAPQVKKPKVISGDDDLPRRDDIGERRRKHELRVLRGAGIKSKDDQDDEPGTIDSDGVDEMNGGDDEMDSDLEFYKQAQRERAAKVAAKYEKHPRITAVSSLPETSVDGKRSINRQIEKNRGLTRSRNKLTKNPRKKYKLKHKKAVVRRKGQVRDIKKPSGPYGGETSGINAGISKSIRLK